MTPQGDEAQHDGPQGTLRPHHAAVEQGQTRCHQHHQGGGDEKPGVISQIHFGWSRLHRWSCLLRGYRRFGFFGKGSSANKKANEHQKNDHLLHVPTPFANPVILPLSPNNEDPTLIRKSNPCANGSGDERGGTFLKIIQWLDQTNR